MASGVIEHCVRHDYGRLVAMLARRVGVGHIELVEDAVQSALVSALATWTEKDPPEDPSAWLYKVAYHRLIQDLRQIAGRARILEHNVLDIGVEPAEASAFFPDEIRDDMLRMLFICCDEVIPLES